MTTILRDSTRGAQAIWLYRNRVALGRLRSAETVPRPWEMRYGWARRIITTGQSSPLFHATMQRAWPFPSLPFYTWLDDPGATWITTSNG
jgi:hypothetical protein